MELLSICDHALSNQIKLRPGEVEQVSSALQIHQQFACISTLCPNACTTKIAGTKGALHSLQKTSPFQNNAGACPTASLTIALRVSVAPLGN
eukprot:9164862-Prorocentrum_lima.AAC.1